MVNFLLMSVNRALTIRFISRICACAKWISQAALWITTVFALTVLKISKSVNGGTFVFARNADAQVGDVAVGDAVDPAVDGQGLPGAPRRRGDGVQRDVADLRLDVQFAQVIDARGLVAARF